MMMMSEVSSESRSPSITSRGGQGWGVGFGQSPNRGQSPRKSGGGGTVSFSPGNFMNFELQIVQSGE